MSIVRPAPRQKSDRCDCDINALREEVVAARKEGHLFGYVPWNKYGGFLWCAKHRVYVRVEVDHERTTA